MGCGYEAPLPAALGTARPWMPPYWIKEGLTSTVCAGYSCALPEVVEVTHAFAQWEAGTLTEWLDGEPPTRALLDGLAALKRGRSERAQAAWDEREAAK